jgi:hypothetical protein
VSKSNNIKYSIESVDGNFVARSTVASFGLDHVTDKDISSYYRKISSQALFDTGLMPLNGTGVLAIRSAGNHTQIAFQHAPQMSYVNWGANEGDRNAVSYHLAQPYRIWIADLLNGNLYGARMFYSPYPITTPDSQLYHLNLPNTNCKGYRGNGVGWICLYHNEDWSNLSFNMKIQKLIERCSGVETYNDANMSETDGPRFYRENNKPEYVYNPVLWEEKSLNEGVDWTLDPDLWLPVLVKDLDNQDRHYPDGQPLTFAMALLGKYNSYYNDENHPKLINAFARPDIEIPTHQVFNIFKSSYITASENSDSYNQFNAAIEEKQKISETILTPSPLLTAPEDINSFTCYSCEDSFDESEQEKYSYGNTNYCEDCFNENFIYCDNTEDYLPSDHVNLLYIEHEQIWIDSSETTLKDCPRCESVHWISEASNQSHPIYDYIDGDGNTESFCSCCLQDFLNDVLKLEVEQIHQYNCYCSCCQNWITKDIPQLSHIFPSVEALSTTTWDTSVFKIDQDKSINDVEINISDFKITQSYFCPTDALKVSWCPSGYWTNNPIQEITPWVSPAFTIKKNTPDEKQVIMKITACSASSYNKHYTDNPMDFKHPFSQDMYFHRAINAVALGVAPAFSNYYTLYNLDGSEYLPEPF